MWRAASRTSSRCGGRIDPPAIHGTVPVSRSRIIGGLRFGVCGLLLAVIFHIIFCNEVQLSLPAGEWQSLSRWQQRQRAWTDGPRALWEMSNRVRPVELAASFGACGLVILVGGLRWRQVLRAQGLDLSVAAVLRISLVAQFFNAFLLGTAGGDVVKAWYAARSVPEKKPEAALTVFADRLLGMVALLMFAAVLMLPNLGLILRYERHAAVALLLTGMLLASGTLIAVGFYSDLLQHDGWVPRMVRRLPKGDSFSRALVACRQFGHHPGFMTRMALWSLAVNVCVVAAFGALAHGLGIELPDFAVLGRSLPGQVTLWYVIPAVVCVAALPVTPAGLGVREHLFVWLLAIPSLGVKPGAALSLSLLGYTVNLLWSVIGGIVYLVLPDREEIAAAGSATE